MCPWISENFNIGTVAIPIQYQVIDCDHLIDIFFPSTAHTKVIMRFRLIRCCSVIIIQCQFALSTLFEIFGSTQKGIVYFSLNLDICMDQFIGKMLHP